MVRSFFNHHLIRRIQSSTEKLFYNFEVPGIDGKPLDLSQFKDKVVIACNVASKCGYAGSNYKQLSELLDKYYDRGLRVVLFPCNQFGGQEPGEACSIRSMADGYNPKFIMADKVKVNGHDALPLYQWMKKQAGGFLIDAIKWNFTKFLIDRHGKVYPTRYSHLDEPNKMIPVIEELLSK